MKTKFLIVLVILIAEVISAQKLKIEAGNFKNLEDISSYQVIFDYTDVKIPKFEDEAAFLKDKMDKREEKKAGDGERFKTEWFNDRPDRYHPKFIESFNKRFENGEISVTENTSDYIMEIHTTKIYPGYNVGIVRHNAEIDATFTIYKSEEKDNILFSGSYRDVQGTGAMGYDYNSGYRISECYAKLAKNIAKEFDKKVL